MSRSEMNSVSLLVVLFFLPGAYGLDFSMGISDGNNGASESQRMNIEEGSSFASSTEASSQYFSSASMAAGPGAFEFDETFHSLDDGEHVRLIAKMSDSLYHVHDFAIEDQTGERISVSEHLSVDQGTNIEASAQAWNSLGLSAKAELKIPAGSLIDYSNYGDAMDESVTADQNAIVPKGTKFSVFAEAKKGSSRQSSGSILKPNKEMNAQTNIAVTKTSSRTKSVLRST